MKQFLFSTLLLQLTVAALAQNKIFIKENGSITDSSKAKYYLIYQKKSDTVFVAQQIEMNNTIIMAGTYKDANLSIPNGRFFYYKKVKNLKNMVKTPTGLLQVNGKITTVDTNVIKTIGQYHNGVKAGIWYDYTTDGNKSDATTFKNDMREGLYESYHNDTVTIRGNYLNDKREGLWLVFTPKGTVMRQEMYEKDKIVKKTIVLPDYVSAVPPDNFEDYLKTDLAGKVNTKTDAKIFINTVIGRNGKLTKSRISFTIGDVVQKDQDAILAAIINCPLLWTPSFEHGTNKIIEDETVFTVYLKEGNISVEYSPIGNALIYQFKH